MDIEKLIEQLNARGLSNGSSLGYHCGLYDEAATALSTLQAENEKLRAEVESLKKGYCAGCSIPAVKAEQIRDLTDAPKLRAELEQVKMECDAAKSTLAERIGVRGAEPITTAFGLPIDRLRELAKADREGRCVVLPCKIGDPVWRLYDDCDFPGDCYTKQKCRGCEYRNLFIEEQAFCLSMLCQNGKLAPPYYTIRAEAEAALRREQDG